MALKATGTAEVKVRMPRGLHRRIQREADRHGQTINAEILVRLEQSFEVMEKFEANAAEIRAILGKDFESRQALYDEIIRLVSLKLDTMLFKAAAKAGVAIRAKGKGETAND